MCCAGLSNLYTYNILLLSKPDQENKTGDKISL